MIKALFILAAIVLAVFGVTKFLHLSSGYVFISFAHWTLETNFWFALIALIVAFIVLHLLLSLFHRLLDLKKNIKNWNTARKHHKAIELTNQGICELAEGVWQRAEKHLTEAAPQIETPFVNYLAAAKAAQIQNAEDRRDYYFGKALEILPNATLAIGIIKSEWQIEKKQWQQALMNLLHLQQLVPTHPYVLTLLGRVCLELNDWHDLQHLLPIFKKYKIMDVNEIHTLEENIQLAHLKKCAAISPAELENAWESLPKAWRFNQSISLFYINALIAHKEISKAISAIELILSKNWYSDLALIYGTLKNSLAAKQLTHAENWLKQHPHDANLLFTLGLLSTYQQLWNKAQHYFQQSIKIDPKSQTFYELGRVLEALGHLDEALVCYRDANRLQLLNQ